MGLFAGVVTVFIITNFDSSAFVEIFSGFVVITLFRQFSKLLDK